MTTQEAISVLQQGIEHAIGNGLFKSMEDIRKLVAALDVLAKLSKDNDTISSP